MICCGILSIPWIVLFYMYAQEPDKNIDGSCIIEDSKDPCNCWVTEGELWVSQYATVKGGVIESDEVLPIERDVAALWRSWFKWAFAVYICLAFFPICAGTLNLC